MYPAVLSETPNVAAILARLCGDTEATNILLFSGASRILRSCPKVIAGVLSRAFNTSLCDCRETSTASAEVTQPEHARQSVSDICAGGRSDGSGASFENLS